MATNIFCIMARRSFAHLAQQSTYYVGANPPVRNDIDAGRARDAFCHYLAIGREQGLPGTRLAEEHCQRAETWLPVAARTALDFRRREAAISVVAVLRDAVPIVLRMLAALRAGLPAIST